MLHMLHMYVYIYIYVYNSLVHICVIKFTNELTDISPTEGFAQWPWTDVHWLVVKGKALNTP